MSVLEDYEKRCRLDPLTVDQIFDHVEAVEDHLKYRVASATDAQRSRVLVWLHDRLQAAYTAIQNPGVPAASRCAWCFRAGPATDEAWAALPKMTLDEAAAHSQVCEHNPMVRRMRELEARNEDLRGRALGIDDNLRDAIRALLKSEAPAGELRRALGELIR